MSLLHEILAVESIRTKQFEALLEDAKRKFQKSSEYFTGYDKNLTLIADSPEKEAIERSSSESKSLPTTVYDTLDYLFNAFNVAEDVHFQKAVTNQLARADIITADGVMIATDVPTDELLSLEKRLKVIRDLALTIPTVSATINVVNHDTPHVLVTAAPEVTTKTEVNEVPLTLSPATDKHPAQIKMQNVTKVIGSFSKITYFGAVTSQEKANVLSRIDNLISAVVEARQRANTTEVLVVQIGSAVSRYIMDGLK